MANRSHHRDAVYGVAVALLLLGAARHYGIYLVPLEHRAQAWNAAGALCIIALVCAVIWHARNRVAQAVAAWIIAEEAMVAGCSLWYIKAPWVVLPGQDQCSALASFDLGLVGVLAITLLVLCLPTHLFRVRDDW